MDRRHGPAPPQQATTGGPADQQVPPRRRAPAAVASGDRRQARSRAASRPAEARLRSAADDRPAVRDTRHSRLRQRQDRVALHHVRALHGDTQRRHTEDSLVIIRLMSVNIFTKTRHRKA